jgi:hypothetical protein
LPIGSSFALALYTEYDHHGWNPEFQVVACGGWMPDAETLRAATWTDPLSWRSDAEEYLLTSSAASGAEGFRDEEVVSVRLSRGNYRIEYAAVEAEYVGCFHRFSLLQKR